jgi:hypothetical protein
LIGGIQPSRIASLVRAAISGELDDGLIQRLQLAVYPDDVREWRLVDRWPNKAATERVDLVIEQLDQIPDEPRSALRFSPEAQEIFNAWYTRHMRESRREELHPALQSHFLKMPQTIAELALLFELIGGGQQVVSAEAATRAIGWAAYLMSHAPMHSGCTVQQLTPHYWEPPKTGNPFKIRTDLEPQDCQRMLSLFADQEREAKLDSLGDPLTLLNKHVDFRLMAEEIDRWVPRPSRAKGGRPPTRQSS